MPHKHLTHAPQTFDSCPTNTITIILFLSQIKADEVWLTSDKAMLFHKTVLCQNSQAADQQNKRDTVA
jgi:hypothetical protein